MTLARLVNGFLLVKLFNLLVNLVRFPVLSRGVTPAVRPSVSLLVPMRNEAATIGRMLPALLAQCGVDEVLILDDESSDGCAAHARDLVNGHRGARVLEGTPAPAGWIGKNWACQQLGSAATGDLLVFCDADIELAPGAVEAVVAEARAQRAAVFSVFPRQRTGTLGERLITPLIDDVLLCFLPFPLLSLDIPAAATANGSLLAFTRHAWLALDGFSAVRGHLVEDVALARLARKSGLQLGLALGGDLIGTRMYRSYRGVVRGLGRGLLPVTGGSRGLLGVAAAWHLLAYTVPLLKARHNRIWALALGLGLVERFLVQRKANPDDAWQAVLTPLSPIAFLPIAAQAMRREQSWKGRAYR